MSLIYEIPKQSRFIQTVNTFSAPFNVAPFLGQYAFDANTGNFNQVIIPLKLNSIYIIERINIGGDIPEEQFAENVSVLPIAFLSFLIDSLNVYPLPIPLVNYVDNQEATAWAWSDKSNDQLLISMRSGVLNQNAFMIGRAAVRLFVSLNIYEITDNNFCQQFKKGSLDTRIGFSSGMGQRQTIITGENQSRL